MENDPSSNGDTYNALVHYQFELDGKIFSGRKISFYKCSTGSINHVQHIVNRYPVDCKVKVYYDAADPSINVLEPGFSLQAFFKPIGGLVFTLAGLFCMNNFIIKGTVPNGRQ